MPNDFTEPAQTLVGLWEFKSSAQAGDIGLTDGQAQNGVYDGNIAAVSGAAVFDGNYDWIDVEGDDAPFDMAQGSIEVEFTQANKVGSSPDTLVSRGEWGDRSSDCYFGLDITENGAVRIQHFSGSGENASLSTPNGFFSPGDEVRVSYNWDKLLGSTLKVLNLTAGTEFETSDSQTGLTFDLGDNEAGRFVFGAREQNDGQCDRQFAGAMKYVAVYSGPPPADGYSTLGAVVFNADGSTLDFSEIKNITPCYIPGTLVATPRGDIPVEDVKVGDKVITRDNGFQEVVWVGHKQVTPRTFTESPELKPVRVRKGALGNGLPERDMIVSPNHRILLSTPDGSLYIDQPEALVAAKHMIGMDGIHRIDLLSATYVHFMCERHEVVLSDGTWLESFQPGDFSLKGIDDEQREEIFALFPELRSRAGREDYTSAGRPLRGFKAKLVP